MRLRILNIVNVDRLNLLKVWTFCPLKKYLMSVLAFTENIGLTFFNYHKFKWSSLITLYVSWPRSRCVSAKIVQLCKGEVLFLGWIFADFSGQHIAGARPSSIQHLVRLKQAQLHDMTFHWRRTKPQLSTLLTLSDQVNPQRSFALRHLQQAHQTLRQRAPPNSPSSLHSSNTRTLLLESLAIISCHCWPI